MYMCTGGFFMTRVKSEKSRSVTSQDVRKALQQGRAARKKVASQQQDAKVNNTKTGAVHAKE